MLCEMRLWGGGSWESRKKSRPSGPWGSSGSRAGKQRLSRAEVCAEIVAGKLPQTLHANGVMVARGWPLGPLPEDLQDTIEIPARVDRNRRGSSVRWKAGGHARGLVVVRIGCTGRSVQINAEHNPRSFRSLPRKERGTGGGIRTPKRRCTGGGHIRLTCGTTRGLSRSCVMGHGTDRGQRETPERRLGALAVLHMCCTRWGRDRAPARST